MQMQAHPIRTLLLARARIVVIVSSISACVMYCTLVLYLYLSVVALLGREVIHPSQSDIASAVADNVALYR
jgi:hypothetical protein